MKVVAAYSIKGGVGKTTAAVNLAYLCAEQGLRTLLWDLDPQGAASYLFRIRPRVKGGSTRLVRGDRPLEAALKGSDFNGLDLLPADVSYRTMDLDLARRPDGSDAKRPWRRLSRLLDTLDGEYDVAFLDTPPGLSLVPENVLHAADVVVAPIIPTVLALRTVDQLATFLDGFTGRRPQLHAFFSLVDRRKGLHRELLTSVPQQRPGFGTAVIPALAVIEAMSVHRAPLPVYAPRSAATRAYRELWAEVAALLALPTGSG